MPLAAVVRIVPFILPSFLGEESKRVVIVLFTILCFYPTEFGD
jgi:hypothetical protein